MELGKIILLRHAERDDYMKMESSRFKGDQEEEINPDITEDGRKQAAIRGVEILNLIGPNTEIYSSPYLRCIQTAEVLQSVMQNYHGKIKITSKISEFQMPQNHMSTTKLLSKTSKYLNDKFIDFEVISDQELCLENHDSFHTRVRHFIEWIKSEEIINVLSLGKSILFVTHGFFIRKFLQIAKHWKESTFPIDYCSMTVARRCPGSNKFDLEIINRPIGSKVQRHKL